MNVGLRIVGVREFVRDLKSVDASLPKELRLENRALAGALLPRVQGAYREYYPKAGSRSRPGRRRTTATGGIRVVATQKSSGIRIGGARYPYLPGQEFGSNRYRQFAPWTGLGPGGHGSYGRFLFPTIRRAMPQVERAYAGVVRRVFERAIRRVG